MRRLALLFLLVYLGGCGHLASNYLEETEPKITWLSKRNQFIEMYYNAVPKSIDAFAAALVMHEYDGSIPEITRLLKSLEIRVLDRCEIHDCRIAGVWLGYHGKNQVELAVDSLTSPGESALCHEYLHGFEQKILHVSLGTLGAHQDATGEHFLLGEVGDSIIAECKSIMRDEDLRWASEQNPEEYSMYLNADAGDES